MTEKELLELYKKDLDFQMYVDKYKEKHKISTEEALSHSIVGGVGVIYATLNQRKPEGVTQ